jgi:hypothetical protein
MQVPTWVSKFWFFFVKDGWLTKNGDRVLTSISLILICTSIWLIHEDRINSWIGFALITLGSVLGLLVGYEGKAKQFGYQAPFTNDPLGWREAKKSYKAEAEDPNEAPGNKNGL